MVGFNQSSQHQQQTSNPVDVTQPEIAKFRDEVLIPAIGGLIGSPLPQGGGQPTSPAAPISPGEQTLLDQLLASFGGSQPRNQLLDQTLQGQFLPGGAQANPFLEATIQAAQRPTQQALEQTLSRTLPGRFTQAGQFVQPGGSSPFDYAAAIATRDASQTMADIATKIASGAYTTERGNQQQAVQLSQQEVQSTIQGLQAAALPRLIQQFGIDQGLQQFQQNLNNILQAIAIAAGLPLSQVGQTSQGSGEGRSFGFSVLGG